MVEYPNKIYTCEITTEHSDIVNYVAHRVIIVAADNPRTAREHVKEKIGIDVEPIWLMNAAYPIIWSSSGSKPLDIQVKILSNLTETLKRK